MAASKAAVPRSVASSRLAITAPASVLAVRSTARVRVPPYSGWSDHRGKRRMRLAVDQDQPATALYDGQGNWRTLVTLNSDGTPELGFADQNTKPRAMIGLQPDGRATFALSGDDGRALEVLTQTSDGPAAFKLFGADGSVVGKMP